jgi:hypothetical protein
LFTSGYAEKSIIHDGRFDSQARRAAACSVDQAKTIEDPNEPELDIEHPLRQISKACPARNISPALTIDRIQLSQIVFMQDTRLKDKGLSQCK